MMPLWVTVPLIVTAAVLVTGLLAYVIDRSNHT
jgi:hypothetical protein